MTLHGGPPLRWPPNPQRLISRLIRVSSGCFEKLVQARGWHHGLINLWGISNPDSFDIQIFMFTSVLDVLCGESLQVRQCGRPALNNQDTSISLTQNIALKHTLKIPLKTNLQQWPPRYPCWRPQLFLINLYNSEQWQTLISFMYIRHLQFLQTQSSWTPKTGSQWPGP